MIGRSVYHYTIVEKLGEGGMGEVFLAEDTKLGRKVALKFLGGQYVDDEGFIDRFRREAQAVAALNDPNIVTIHEVGEFEGRPYIAMTYVDGQSLADVIAGGDVSIDRACELARQIGSGLAHAHDVGITHRDIKPDNVLLDRSGRVNILDFGLAKLKGVSTDSGDQSTLGTIYYMSPEQASGGAVDHRSDIFSLGSVLYEMLTGVPPFKREHSAAVLYSIVNEEPVAPRKLNPKISPELEEVLMRALAKGREERYQSAGDFADDLERAHGGGKPAASLAKSQLRRILLPTSVVFVVILLIAILRPFQFQLTGQQKAIAAHNSLAVMYFENVVEREDPQRLGEIVTNLLITDLSESKYMDVVSSQRLYDILKLEGKEGAKAIDRSTASDVARKAGAKWMLLGSILQTAPNLVVTSQLIEVETGKVAASQRMTGDADEDIFQLVDRLTDEIKGDLAVPEAPSDMDVADATTHSTEAYRYYLRGVEAVNKFYGNEARDAFEQAIEHDSTMAMAYLRLASNDVPGSRRNKLDYIENARRYAANSSERERMYIESTASVLNGDVEEAIAILEGILEKYPEEKEAHKGLGRIYRQNNRDAEKSIAHYRAAIAIDPMDKNSYNILAYEYQAIGDVDNYIWAIHQYMTLAPDEPNPYDSRGDLYAYSGKIDKAISSYERALEMKSDFFPSLRKIGIMYMFAGDFKKARRHYDQLAKNNNKFERAGARTLRCLIPQYRGRFREALKELNIAAAADRSDEAMDGDYRAKFMMRAVVLSEQGRHGEALELIDEILPSLKAQTPDSELLVKSFQIYFLARMGDFETADKLLADIEAALAAGRDDLFDDYWSAKGHIEFNRGNTAIACEAFEKAITQDNGFQTRYSLALAYLEDGRLTEAINEYQKLLREYSETRAYNPIFAAKAYYHAGVAYESAGKPDKARIQYETFLDLWQEADKDNSTVDDARRRLEGLGQS